MTTKKSAFEMQELFIKHLKNTVPANVSLVDDIADLLKISNDNAYIFCRFRPNSKLFRFVAVGKHYHY